MACSCVVCIRDGCFETTSGVGPGITVSVIGTGAMIVDFPLSYLLDGFHLLILFTTYGI